MSTESQVPQFPVSAVAVRTVVPASTSADTNPVALLGAIAARAPQSIRANLVATLKTPGSAIGSTSDPVLRDLIRRYYNAQRHTYNESHRLASAAAAATRKTTVAVVIGTPPTGTIAAVHRRRLVTPRNVIVLSPSATAATFAGALRALTKSRLQNGDNLIADEQIGLRSVVAPLDSAYEARLETLLGKLRAAPSRAINGVGTVKAIPVRTGGIGSGR